ncbi:MAG: 16S rRNA (guanine(966)-N(2))-methyltransferase RsmD [Actinomycetota bacterium]
MRVIAGVAKGVRLGAVPPGVRPMTDRVREGLFASLADRVEDARCLDLFAGTGATGIEALSRGASHGTFVDRSRKVTAAIEGNLKRTDLEDHATVRTSEVIAFLRRGRPAADEPYDLVFLDPPYELQGAAFDGCFGLLDGGWLAGTGWTVMVTRGQKGSLPAVPLHWAVARQLRYGDSLLTLYREVGWA